MPNALIDILYKRVPPTPTPRPGQLQLTPQGDVTQPRNIAEKHAPTVAISHHGRVIEILLNQSAHGVSLARATHYRQRGESIIESKKCTLCREEKPLEAFHNDKRNRDGKQSWCRSCTRDYGRGLIPPRRNREPVEAGLKRCSKCEQAKPLADFSKDSGNKDGKRTECRECTSRARLERRLRNADRRLNDPGIVPKDKKCSRCQVVKPIDSFHDNRGSVDGKQSYCRECSSEYSRLPAQVEKQRSYRREHRVHKPEQERKYRLKRVYNITPEQFDDMLTEQGGRCANCRTDTPGKKGWNIDHDHECCPGKNSCGECICAILCGNCNVGIAMFHHDPDLILSAAAYVIKTRESAQLRKERNTTCLNTGP